ncbi:M56 family metallopeptidase [Granulicella tundricola]|uniref:TonB family protein n=1 Tax=Granulicella tundricola (strain ATCC BAA-1859 / DSM 23138 / MP5ACTX9) TaxID=1198114 RepID=E8WZM3_GRATM|nr:M56 family metallopeptidase [Granulicella tundricola]ADW69997.1 TonB family protein [Granulicella tundricola MP5ACTX9]
MNSFESFLLGYLLNSLWQLPFLFAAAWLAALALRPFGPTVEHRVWAIALLLQSLLPALSLASFQWLTSLAPWFSQAGPTAPGQVSVTVGPGLAAGNVTLSTSLLTGIAVLYTLAIAFFLIRLIRRAGTVLHLRRTAVPTLLTPEAEAVWQQCCRHFNLITPNAPTVALSLTVLGPVTFGLRRPVVLFPSGMIPSLPLPQLEAVMAHECAHLYRKDFALNLLYEAASLLISFHPILWLTRERLIETREMSCDHLAAQLVGPTPYGQSLLRLASLLITGRSARAPHAIGILDANIFERRIMKLTEKTKPLAGTRRTLILAACTAFALATCGSALALRLNVATPTSTSTLNGKDSNQAGTAKIAGGVMAGNILTKSQPKYPEQAKKDHIQGAVLLHAIIGKDGTIENLTVISGPQELQTSALDAVRQWVYKPYLLNGEPTEVDTTITVNYSLAN